MGLLLVTTLPAKSWSTEQLLELYRARWQIEVLFKRIKDVLALHSLPAQTPQGAQAMICAVLVAWMLIEDDVESLRRQFSDGEAVECPLSSWRLAHLAFEALRKVLEGTGLLSACGPCFQNCADCTSSGARGRCANINAATSSASSCCAKRISLCFSVVQVLKLTPKTPVGGLCPPALPPSFMLK